MAVSAKAREGQHRRGATYREKHKEEVLKRNAIYREDNREELRIKEKAFYQDNKEKVKKAANKYHRQMKERLFTHYSNGVPKCARCGITDLDILCIDHVNGGGHQHRLRIGITSGYKFYLWLIREGYPDGFQVLCFNCNIKKRMTEGL